MCLEKRIATTNTLRKLFCHLRPMIWFNADINNPFSFVFLYVEYVQTRLYRMVFASHEKRKTKVNEKVNEKVQKTEIPNT
jgi:hypothetical protein